MDGYEWTDKDVYGLETLSLPEDHRPLEAVVIIKCLTPDGPRIAMRFTRSLPNWEALGLVGAADVELRHSLRESFNFIDGPDEEPGPDEPGS